MSQTVTDEQGTVHEFPDEATPAQMLAALKQHGHAAAPEPPAPKLDFLHSLGLVMSQTSPFAHGAGHIAIESLPTALGLGGEIAGGAGAAALAAPTGPGAIIAGLMGKTAGGAAGGAVGRVARNAAAASPLGALFGNEPASSLTEGVGREAAIQGGASALGVPLAGAAERVAGVLTGKTLARAAAVAEDAARGSNKMTPRVELLDGLKMLEAEAQRMGTREVKALEKLKASFMGGDPQLTALDLHDLRQTADKVAKGIHDAKAAKQVVGPKQAMRGRFWEQVANYARGILKESSPEYAAAMKESQKAIGSLKRVPVVSDAPIRGTLTNPFGVPEMATRALLGRPAMDAYGRVLDSPATQGALGLSPRTLAYFAELLSQPQDSTATGGR